MRTWNWIQYAIAQIFRLKGTEVQARIDTNRRERALRIENIKLKKEMESRQGFQVVYIDPAIRQRGYEQSAWNAEPERHTGPRHVMGVRQRATMREVYQKSGDLVQHVNEVERTRDTTRRLDPETKILPESPKPHRFDLMIHGEPLPDDTLHTPATWLL